MISICWRVVDLAFLDKNWGQYKDELPVRFEVEGNTLF